MSSELQIAREAPAGGWLAGSPNLRVGFDPATVRERWLWAKEWLEERLDSPRLTRRRKVGLSIAVSALVHVAVLGVFLAPAGRGVFGYPGRGLGTAIDVSLVAGLDLGDGRGAPPTILTASDRMQPPVEAKAVSTADGQQAEPRAAEGEAEAPNDPASPASKAQQAAAQAPESAMVYAGNGGGALSRGGDPNAAAVLLQQIARCLPPQERPNLGSRALAIRIDEHGGLRAAPEISANSVLAGAEERAQADRIIQAALQCGPYDGPGLSGQDFDLIPDFSGIAPRLALRSAARD